MSTGQETSGVTKNCRSCGGSGVHLSAAERHAARVARVLRLARNTLNAKGGATAEERRIAVSAVTNLLNDMGAYL